MVTLSYTLDMYPRAVPVVVHLNQYDSDFELVFTLMTSCGTFNIQSSTTAEIRGTKSDGNGYSANCTIDIANSKVTVAGHNQMTAASGKNTYELVLKKNDKVLSTANFILWVEPAAMDAGTITSDTVLKELNAIIESASIATEAAEDAGDAADRAEAAAETLEIDATLTQAGQAADAKKTGDEISDLKSAINHVLSAQLKTALLGCFDHVAWKDDYGRDYYDALYDALYNSDPRIVYEIPHGTDISDWSIDTEQHAFTLDEDFTFLAKVSWLPSESGAFLLDSQSVAGAIVGVRIQSGMSDNNTNVYFLNQFNGGTTNSGAGTRTFNTFPANVSHNVICIMKNDNKNLTIKTYVDGQLEYSDNRTLADKENTYPSTYYIGKNHSDTVRLWTGTVDLYRIYNEALTDSEIATILELT